MYRTLLSDYDMRQRELVLENSELKKVMQQMRKEMVSILKSRKLVLKGAKHELNGMQVGAVLLFHCNISANAICKGCPPLLDLFPPVAHNLIFVYDLLLLKK